MAHYAIIDENNIVQTVFVGKDENDPLPIGYTSWEEYYGAKRYSYNTEHGVHRLGGTPFRKNFAIIGGMYDPIRDAFIPPKIYNSWILNEEICDWEPPVVRPSDGVYRWNEDEVKWDFVAPLPPDDGKLYDWNGSEWVEIAVSEEPDTE